MYVNDFITPTYLCFNTDTNECLASQQVGQTFFNTLSLIVLAVSSPNASDAHLGQLELKKLNIACNVVKKLVATCIDFAASPITKLRLYVQQCTYNVQSTQ